MKFALFTFFIYFARRFQVVHLTKGSNIFMLANFENFCSMKKCWRRFVLLHVALRQAIDAVFVILNKKTTPRCINSLKKSYL